MRIALLTHLVLSLGWLGLATGIYGQTGDPTDKKPTYNDAISAGSGPLLLVTTALRATEPAKVERPISPPPDRTFVRPPEMRVTLEVLVEGRVLRTIVHEGKTYLPVPSVNAEYQLRVWNHGPRRIVAIVSVDGLSVLNGQPASENHAGYVVAPYDHIVIKGWRRNMDTVAAFRFVDREKSYAALMGKAENIGVLGLIAIEEEPANPHPLAEDRATSAPSSKRALVGSIGTEYGREIDSRIYYVPFVRSANKRAITIYYDTREALRRAGVPVDRPMPVPFPGDEGFVPPPPDYRR